VTRYQQDFEHPGLFVSERAGDQTFSDGAQFSDLTPFATLRRAFGEASGHALGLRLAVPAGDFAQVFLSVPAIAESSERLRVRLRVFNPTSAEARITLHRAFGPRSFAALPASGWTTVTAELTSTSRTGAVVIDFGLLPAGAAEWRFDDLVVEQCP